MTAEFILFAVSRTA